MVASRCPPVPARPSVPAAVPPDDRGGAPRAGRGTRARRAACATTCSARCRRRWAAGCSTATSASTCSPDVVPSSRASSPASPRATPGLTVRRGVAVHGVLVDRDGGAIPRVSGVRTADGEMLPADLVVDAAGRRSPLAGLLDDAGVRRPHELIDDVGYAYYARDFHRADGGLPALRGPISQAIGSINISTLPADHGWWSVVVVTASSDRPLRAGARRRRLGSDRREVPDGPPLDRGRRGVRRRHRPRCRGSLARPGHRRPAGGHRRRQRRRRVGVHQPDRRARGLDRRAARGGAARPPPRRVGRSGRGIAAVGGAHRGDRGAVVAGHARRRRPSSPPDAGRGRAASGTTATTRRGGWDGRSARRPDRTRRCCATCSTSRACWRAASTSSPVPVSRRRPRSWRPRRSRCPVRRVRSSRTSSAPTRVSRSHDGAASAGHRRARPRNASSSRRNTGHAGSWSVRRWLRLSSGTSRLPGIRAASSAGVGDRHCA